MKKARLILSASLLTIGAFSAVTFSSCSKDDKVCTTGYSGSDCKTEVRTSYYNTYRGDGTDNAGGTYTNWALRFSAQGTDATKMQLEILDDANANQFLFTATLSSNTTFSIEPKSIGLYTYTGSGSITATTATFTLTEKDNTTGTVITTILSFPNLIK